MPKEDHSKALQALGAAANFFLLQVVWLFIFGAILDSHM